LHYAVPLPSSPRSQSGAEESFEKGILGGEAAQNTLNPDSPSRKAGKGVGGWDDTPQKCVTPGIE
jgi:hypothetical protein